MNKQSKVLKWALIIGIVIVLNMFFNYALSLIYKNPQFEAFCPNSQVITVPDNQKACVDNGGQWTNNTAYNQPVMVGVKESVGYCDLQYTCRNNYDSAQKVYDRNVFLTLVLLGAICVALATSWNFFKVNMLVSTALSLAGVLSFIIASMRYWSSADDLIKVIILAIALGILVWVAIKKFNDKE